MGDESWTVGGSLVSEAGKDNAETQRTLRYAEEEKHCGEGN
jgi:hypothetical protein